MLRLCINEGSVENRSQEFLEKLLIVAWFEGEYLICNAMVQIPIKLLQLVLVFFFEKLCFGDDSLIKRNKL